MIADLPALSAISNVARRKLVAALRGVPARGLSDAELERKEEQRAYEAMMLDQFRAQSDSKREFNAAVKSWRDLHQRLAFLTKIAALIEEQRREEELGRYFEIFAQLDTPPRKIVDALGLRYVDVIWRMKCAHDDLARRKRGELTRRQVAERERQRYWAELRDELARGSEAAKP